MKRLLLLPLLLFGLSFSCDQPYEEVAGIMIGCPVKYLDNFEEYIDLGLETQGAKVFHLPLKDAFFDSSNIYIIDDSIEQLILKKSNFRFDKDIMYDLIKNLTGRWGDVEIISDDAGFREHYAFNISENDEYDGNMSFVLLSYSLGDQELNLIYTTKKQDLTSKRLDDEIKKQRSDQFNQL